MYETTFATIFILAILYQLLPVILAFVSCVIMDGKRPSKKRSASRSAASAQRASSSASAAAHGRDGTAGKAALSDEMDSCLWAAEQMRRRNEQARQANELAMQQHQQFVDQVNQQQFNDFCLQSVTPIEQGGFIPTGMGMF